MSLSLGKLTESQPRQLLMQDFTFIRRYKVSMAMIASTGPNVPMDHKECGIGAGAMLLEHRKVIKKKL